MSQFKDSDTGSLFTKESTQDGIVSIISERNPNDNNFGVDVELEEIELLTVRNTVLFPRVIMPITVVKQHSIRLVKKVSEEKSYIGIVTQKTDQTHNIQEKNIYKIGTIAKILKYFSMPDGNVTIFVQGFVKFYIKEFHNHKEHLAAKITILQDIQFSSSPKIIKALVHSLREAILKMLELTPDTPTEASLTIKNIENPTFFIYFLSSNVNIVTEEKQELLEMMSAEKQAKKLLAYIQKEIQFLEIKNNIRKKAHTALESKQREIFLRQQVKALQDELGDTYEEDEIYEMKRKAKRKKWSKKAKEAFDKEIKKMEHYPPNSMDYSISLGYCELLLELPWHKYSKSKIDLKKAIQVLDADHYGLKKVKERIIEYLAVLQLKSQKISNTTKISEHSKKEEREQIKSPILCLVGPPGVGKTSLGGSIARSLSRKYARIALGGMKDEAELRGHRRTYIGAMPGRIIQHLNKTEVSNPVFILDEIDKISHSFTGDPASALLEILDPEQNSHFSDNYLEVEYDLSKIFFICTANSLNSIHPALLDRMEIIEMSSYTMEEKKNIAIKYLVPKAKKETGLTAANISFENSTVENIILYYTREAGVRNLNQKITKVMRKRAKELITEEPFDKKIKTNDLQKYLGTQEYDLEEYSDALVPGIAIGMAWTSVGGEILFIESTLLKGTGKLILSGQLGDVMKESATAAQTYIQSSADKWGINFDVFKENDLHIHIPAGAVPKDGPSAGITMTASIFSTYTQKTIQPVAITGEITLSGKVLPVGGIKEKVLAAKRAGLGTILLPDKNRKDIEDIETEYLGDLKFKYVSQLPEALDFLFDKK